MRKRSSSALVLACISFGWLAWVRQRADGADETLAALQLEVATLNAAPDHHVGATDRPLALAAELQVGVSALPEGFPKPLAPSQPQVPVPALAPAQTVIPRSNADGTQDLGQQAAVATGQRGECASHPVVFWHYPKTGLQHILAHFVSLPTYCSDVPAVKFRAKRCLPIAMSTRASNLFQAVRCSAKNSSYGLRHRRHQCGRRRDATLSPARATQSSSARRTSMPL